MVRSSRICVLLLVAGSCAAFVGTAHGQTPAQWAAGVSGNWNDAARWSPAVVPDNFLGTTYDVTLPNFGTTYTVTLDIPRDVDTLSLDSSGVVGQTTILDVGANQFDTTGDFTLTRSQVSGNGSTGRIVVGGTATFTNGVSMGANFTTNGSVVFAGSVEEEFCDTGFDHNGSSALWNGTGNIRFMMGTVFTNSAASTFTINHAGNQQLIGDAADTFINSGTISKEGAGQTTFQGVTFNASTGTVKVENGSLKFLNSGVGTGGTLAQGKFEVADGAALSTTDATDVDIALIVNQAEVTLRGANSSFVSLNSITTNAPGAKLNFADGRSFTTAGDLTNAGLITLTTGSNLVISPGVANTFNSGSIRAESGSTVTVAAGASLFSTGSVVASGGTVNFQPTSQLQNIVGNTISGGVFIAENAGILTIPQLVDVSRIDSSFIVTGAASDIRSVTGLSVLPTISSIGPNGTLQLNGRNVEVVNDFTVEGNGATRGRLIVARGTTFSVAEGQTLTNFVDGRLENGQFTIRGTLIGDNLSIEEVDNEVLLDDADGRIINRQTGLDALSSLRLIRPNADLTVSNGRDLLVAANLTSQPGGQLRIGAPVQGNQSTVRIQGDYIANGSTIFNGGELFVAGTFQLNGAIRGNGTINGRVINNGIIAPGFSPGSTLINGDVTNTAGSVVEMEIAGSVAGVSYDQLSVNGTFGFENLGSAGILRITLLDGFLPADGEVFNIIRATRFVGLGFSSIEVLGLDDDAWIEVVYLERSIQAIYHVPAPGAAFGLTMIGLFSMRRRR